MLVAEAAENGIVKMAHTQRVLVGLEAVALAGHMFGELMV